MADYRLSARAVTDLAEIADYTVATFGVEQARRYRDDLESCFEYLADNPLLGRSAESLAPGLRRFEHRSHAIFYTKERGGVLIVRILHTRMDARRHLPPAPPQRWSGVQEPREPEYRAVRVTARPLRARPRGDGYLILASL